MPQLTEQVTDQFENIANVGHRVAQTGGLTTVGAWLLSSQGGVLIGILIGLVGLVIQVYYRRKQDAREEAEHKLRMTLRADTLGHGE